MERPQAVDYTAQLQQHMEAAGVPSFRALAAAAAVSRTAVLRLRQGQIGSLRLEQLHRLSRVLGLSLSQLVQEFSPQAVPEPSAQAAALETLEPWLLQWPTAVYAVEKNPQLPAERLLPLVRPVEALLEQWGVVAIATVGTDIPYDPQQHQLMSGSAEPGELVRVRYTGYRQGQRLLFRAKVSPTA